jgi:hypothetical protein
MSLSETISPTQERFHKGDRIEAPEYSQSVKRPAFRVLHKFEELYEAGKINKGCKEAGMKLLRHHQGMLGHDVRLSVLDGIGGDSDPHGHLQPASIHHGQKLAEARAHVLSRNTKTAYATWLALMRMVEGTGTLEEVGRNWGHKNAPQARAVGLTIIAQTLEELAVLWGFSQAYHAKNPPSR